MAKKSAGKGKTAAPRLLQLLTDPNEIRDVLEAYGKEAPETDLVAHQQLMEILGGVSEETLLNTCFALAADFARMSHEILDWCGEFGITGQIQLRTANLAIPPSGLDSSWAFAADPGFGADADQRAVSIAAAVEEQGRRIDSEHVVGERTEREETDLGRAMRQSPNPVHNIYRQVLDGMERTIHYDVVRDGDLRLLKTMLEEIETLRTQTPLPAPLTAAFDGVERRGRACVEAMNRVELIEGEASRDTLALCDDIRLLAQQARELAEDTAAAERTQGGFRDFLRTDFWFQRWRIYELWVLTRVLRVLERVGARTELLRSEGGAWRLQYGRDTSPVASAVFPNGRVDVFYQLFEKEAESADMPDIALRDSTGDFVAIIDPKHGKSYRRSKVDEILRRYGEHFRAGLTAMVNYYPIAGYDFDEYRIGARRLVLASDIAPGTLRLRRLELNLEDLLLQRNLARRETIATKEKAMPRQPAPQSGVLVYYASTAREVDEPAGVWSSSGPVTALAPWFDKDTTVFDAAPGGRACIVAHAGVWTLFRERHAPQSIDVLSGVKLGFHESPAGWNPQGTQYAVCADDLLTVVDESGGVVLSMRLTADDDEAVKAIGWTASGLSLFFEVGPRLSLTGARGALRRLDLRVSPPGVSEYAVQVASKFSLRDGEVFGIGIDRGTVVRTASGDRFRLSVDERQLTPEQEREEYIAASPSGLYLVAKGPRSLHHDDGVRLLKVMQSSGGTELPLIRFSGDVIGRIRWNPDESRFAFRVRREEDAEVRLIVARIGDRYAAPMPQDGKFFGWLSPALLQRAGTRGETQKSEPRSASNVTRRD